MSLNVRGLRTKRVRANEAALTQIKTRLRQLHQEQAAANALLAEAKRAADNLERETRVLQDIERNMAAELEASRAELVQECVSNLPDDILRCIFAEAVSDGEAHAPFTIAAVCAQWRRVALDFSAMWSTIHIDSGPFADAEECRRHLTASHKRAAVLLSRSRSAPLNITIWAKLTTLKQHLPLIRRLFDLVGAHASRWRTASLSLPSGADRACLDFLKGPTPLLVELKIDGSSGGRAPSPSESEYLPFAPRLKTLQIDHESGMGCSTRHGFPLLEQLILFGGACTGTQTFDYLRMSSRSLQHLVLCTWITHGPSATIDLPSVIYLGVLVTSFPLLSQPIPAIRTPVLQHLDLGSGQPDDINDTLLPFLDAVSRTVRRLTLTQTVSARSLPILARLKNIKLLDFHSVSTAFICNDALEIISTSQPPIWPRLARIKNMTFSADSDTGWSANKLLDFVVSRNLPAPARHDPHATGPCKLQEAAFIGETPHWLVAEVQRLLAL